MKTYFKELVKKGGPSPDEYPLLTKTLTNIFNQIGRNKKNHPLIKDILYILQPTLTCNTMQGFSYKKPHGYCGDFELIDRIYQNWISPFTKLRRWDYYFHSQQFPQAVKNSKDYFVKLLLNLENKFKNTQPKVLNIMSSPARGIREYFDHSPYKSIDFDCIDFNNDAISYAEKICLPYLFKIHFYKSDIIKYKPLNAYHLIWSSCLFNYFSDTFFVKFVKRLSRNLEFGGKLVISCFSKHNPSRAYLECVGRWFVEHRSEEKLVSLAKEAGIHPINIEVKKDPSGINQYLYIRK